MKEYKLQFRFQDFKDAYLNDSYLNLYLSNGRGTTLITLIVCSIIASLFLDQIGAGAQHLFYYFLFFALAVVYFSFAAIKDFKYFLSWRKSVLLTARKNADLVDPMVKIQDGHFFFMAEDQIQRHGIDSLTEVKFNEDRIYLEFGTKPYMLPKASFFDGQFEQFLTDIKASLVGV